MLPANSNRIFFSELLVMHGNDDKVGIERPGTSGYKRGILY